MSKELGNLISKILLKKYSISINEYNKIMINHLLKSSQMHYISVFKDYLFYDDISEFLNRFYNKNEIKKKIYNITKYYQNSSKLYPNYSPLNEAKYIYKNIERKQRIIDLIEGNKNNMKRKKKENNIIFNSTIYNSILAENYNDRSKLKDLFGSNIFRNNEKDNDSFISIINFTNSLTKIIDNNNIKKETEKYNLKNISYSNNKTNMTTISNQKETNKKENKIKKKHLNSNVTKLIKQNINLSKKLNILKLNNKILQYNSNYLNIKEKSRNKTSKTKKEKNENKTEIKSTKIVGKNYLNNSKFKNLIKLPLKHEYFQSMKNKLLNFSNIKNKITKFEITEKKLINKTSRNRNSFPKEILQQTISNTKNKSSLKNENDKFKTFFHNIILETQRNIVSKIRINNSLNKNKTIFHSEKQNKKTKTKIS